jgi:hypothetical protein
MMKSPEYRKSFYRVSGVEGDTPKHIDKVTIDNCTFTDYSAFTFLMEKSYVKSPVRSSDGSIENLDSYATFLTPHLKIDFSLMSINSYRTLMKLLRSRNEFTVTCYDIVNDIDVTHKMYFATEQMPKLWSIAKAINGDEWVELLGVQEYTVELIGTNTAFDTVTIIYHFNPPSSSGLNDYTIGSDNVPKGSEIILGDIASSIKDNAPSGYKFKEWVEKNSDSSETIYTDGIPITLNDKSLVLYAKWESTSNYTLNFSYGLSSPAINDDMTYKYSAPVVYGKSIGNLPVFDVAPTVIYGSESDTKYTPYFNGAWYKTPIKTNKSLPVTSEDLYWIEQDSTIYLLYDTHTYEVRYYLDGELYNTTEIQYGVPVPLPKLIKSGHTFDGWYTDSQHTNKFSGIMPPFSFNLYGRLVADE